MLTSLKGNMINFCWILVLIVIVSLAGFGIQDVILGTSTRNIATVGNKKISIDEFVTSIENEMFRFSRENNVDIGIKEAKDYGLVNKVLNDLIAKKIFDNLLAQKELSRGDESVANYIKTVETFKNINGEFDVEKYKRFVAASGTNIKEFENTLKNDLARELILDVFAAPKNIDTLIFQKSIGITLKVEISQL